MPGHDRITPEGKRFFAELKKLSKLQVRVGLTAGGAGFGSKHQSVSADATMAEIAAWNELGTAHTPPRPFLRQSVDKNESQIKAMVAAQITAIAKGEATAEKALQAIGAMQVGLVQAEMKSGGFAPNAPSTIKKKGSAVPLIDTGRLRQSIHYAISEKGKE